MGASTAATPTNNITLPIIDPTNIDKTKTDSLPKLPRCLSSSIDGIIGSRTIRKTLYRPGKNHPGIIKQNCSNKKQLKSSIDGVLGFRNYIKSNDETMSKYETMSKDEILNIVQTNYIMINEINEALVKQNALHL
jgi:hypothetical protein